MKQIKVYVLTKTDTEGKLEFVETYGPHEKFLATEKYVGLVKDFFAEYYVPTDFVNVPVRVIQELYFDQWLNTGLLGRPVGLVELHEEHINVIERASAEESYNNMLELEE